MGWMDVACWCTNTMCDRQDDGLGGESEPFSSITVWVASRQESGYDKLATVILLPEWIMNGCKGNTVWPRDQSQNGLLDEIAIGGVCADMD